MKIKSYGRQIDFQQISYENRNFSHMVTEVEVYTKGNSGTSETMILEHIRRITPYDNQEYHYANRLYKHEEDAEFTAWIIARNGTFVSTAEPHEEDYTDPEPALFEIIMQDQNARLKPIMSYN